MANGLRLVHRHLLENDRLDWRRSLAAPAELNRHASNGIKGIESGRDLAEDRVVGRESGVGMNDEELAAVGVRSRIGHRHGPALVLALHWLVGKLVTWATHSCAGRVTALHHEPTDDAVEWRAVVVTILGKVHEVVDGIGRVIDEEFDVQRALARLKGRGVGLACFEVVLELLCILIGHENLLRPIRAARRQHPPLLAELQPDPALRRYRPLPSPQKRYVHRMGCPDPRHPV